MGWGADTRLTIGPWLFSAELLKADFSVLFTPERRASGYHITGGYSPTSRSQVLLRYDVFRAAWLGVES